MTYHCVNCAEPVNPKRWQLGRHTCLPCGERLAREFKHCIVPLAKSNYQPVTDPSILRQLNKYSKG